MTIHILGETTAANNLREYLASLGYTLAGRAAYTITLEEVSAGIALIGTRGPLADEALHSIAELTAAPLQWSKSAVAHDGELRVVAPKSENDAVARGLLRALLKITGHGVPQTGWRNLLRRIS